MAKLPSSFRAKNRTTEQYRKLYAALPAHIQQGVRDTCVIFDADPNANSLRIHNLTANKRGQHQDGSISVSVTMKYRAIYVKAADGMNVWYWIGTHADYDVFTGKK